MWSVNSPAVGTVSGIKLSRTFVDGVSFLNHYQLVILKPTAVFFFWTQNINGENNLLNV